MFNNIGNKIKILAVVISIITIVCCVFIAIYNLSEGAYLYALIYAVVGPMLAWISSFLLYGFGQLIENSDKMAQDTDDIVRQLTDLRQTNENSKNSEITETNTSTEKPQPKAENLDDLLKNIIEKK